MLRRRIRSATMGGFVLGTIVSGPNHLFGQTKDRGNVEKPRLRTPSIPFDEPKSNLAFAEEGAKDLTPAKIPEIPAKLTAIPVVTAPPSAPPAPAKLPAKEQANTPRIAAKEQVPLLWQIASAAHVQISPFLVWAPPPPENPTEVKPETLPLVQADKSVENPTMDALNDKKPSNEAIAGGEPADLEFDPGLPPVDLQKVEDVREMESSSKGSVATAKEEVPKRPRPVRIPFAGTEATVEPSGETAMTSKSAPTVPGKGSLAELDEERRQEEPAIDVPAAQNGKEDQGVDALLAAKPGTHKREIVIEDPESIGKSAPSIAPTPALAPNEAARLSKCNDCLSFYLKHPESTSVRSPWAVMHALLAFGPEYELQHGDSQVNAIGWMCHNGTCRTQRIFTPRGRGFVPNVGAGVQGHEGQFLAILAQSNVPLDYPIQIGANKFKIEDLVRYEMATCKERSELTFKLIGLSYYLDSNKQWRANDGRVWSIQKLIQEELAQPVVGAACGGTHRLMGFSFSVRQRSLQGQPINGQFARADQFVRNYVDYTWTLQNPDGSFSTSWYEGRGNEPNEERKVQTTGHMLEWLMYTLPDNEINQPRVQKSIDFLLSKIYDKKEHKWPIGPRGHATRAVALYQARYQEILKSSPDLLKPKAITAVTPKASAPRR